MRIGKRILMITLTGVILTVGSTMAIGLADKSVGTLKEYFDLLVSGNVDIAHSLWYQPCLDRAGKFGIEFEDIPIKADCGSPVIRDLPRMRDFLATPARQVKELDELYSQLEFSQLVAGVRVKHLYHTFYDGNYLWLVYPQDYYAQDWPVIETGYLRIHVDPLGIQPNELAMQAADLFIENLSHELGLSDNDLKIIKEKKIEYFLCSSDKVVEQITGHLIKGTLDMGSNDIISAFFPHYHELVHLLVNIRLKKLSLYTQPIVREGIAVHYGGRWGKSRDALTGLGIFLYQETIVELDSLLTMKFFSNSATADIAYPVAGILSAFLIDNMGIDSYLQMYRQLSGRFDPVYSMSIDDVKSVITEQTGHSDWSSFLTAFDDYLKNAAQMQKAMLPGIIEGGKSLIESQDLKVTEKDKWINFEFSFMAGTDLSGNLLFGYNKLLDSSFSSLFDEQYKGEQPMNGFRYGIRFDGNEAGLYDYATDHLMTKYIWGIEPSDEYHNKVENVIAFRIRSNLLDVKALKDGPTRYLTH